MEVGAGMLGPGRADVSGLIPLAPADAGRAPAARVRANGHPVDARQRVDVARVAGRAVVAVAAREVTGREHLAPAPRDGRPGEAVPDGREGERLPQRGCAVGGL